MIQDIAPHCLMNQYQPQAKAKADSPVIFFDEKGAVLVKDVDSELIFPTVSQLGEERDYQYLFSVDEQDYFLLWLPVGKTAENRTEAMAPATHEEDQMAARIPAAPEGFVYLPIPDVRKYHFGPKHLRYALYTARHLDVWYASSRFCGKCGSPTVRDDVERAMKCPACGAKIYPKIMPAVIVGVKNGERLLLTKYARGFRENALIAGFVEIGESVEETVAREVMEEAGVKVKNIQYYKSQPWGVAGDILMGYYCEVDGDDTIHMDESELKYAEWVAREDIILQTNNDSLTNEMMKMFKEGLQ